MAEQTTTPDIPRQDLSLAPPRLSPRWCALLLLAITAAMLAVGASTHLRGGASWLAELALLTALFAVVGQAVTAFPTGLLVDPRNRMSLSQLQTVLWTAVVLSAYLDIVMRRMGEPDPLAVAIDWHLWALMGISTASLVGTPLIQGLKAKGPPDAAAPPATAKAPPALPANASVADARLTDIFSGEQRGGTTYVDLSKVQMFVLTAIAVASYGASLYHLIDGTAPAEITGFPPVPPGLVALLGVSNAGYLGAQAAS